MIRGVISGGRTPPYRRKLKAAAETSVAICILIRPSVGPEDHAILIYSNLVSLIRVKAQLRRKDIDIQFLSMFRVAINAFPVRFIEASVNLLIC